MTKYEDIMAQSWDELPEPQNLPVGLWLLRGKNAVHFPKKEEDKNARVVFFYTAREPLEDVNTVELEALGVDYDFASNELSHTIWIESDADWKRKVLAHLAKHSGWQAGANITEGLKNFRGTEVIAFMGKRSRVDKTDGSVREENVLSAFQAAD